MRSTYPFMCVNCNTKEDIIAGAPGWAGRKAKMIGWGYVYPNLWYCPRCIDMCDVKVKEETYYKVLKGNPVSVDAAVRLVAVIAAAQNAEGIEETIKAYGILKHGAMMVVLETMKAQGITTKNKVHGDM